MVDKCHVVFLKINNSCLPYSPMLMPGLFWPDQPKYRNKTKKITSPVSLFAVPSKFRSKWNASVRVAGSQLVGLLSPCAYQKQIVRRIKMQIAVQDN
jgi:hypothetical protein